jgi:hypothetical protein
MFKEGIKVNRVTGRKKLYRVTGRNKSEQNYWKE